ncbi:MAG: peptidogalycan biosysnthesis protein [Candidatus Scalinduaceae bacterium]
MHTIKIVNSINEVHKEEWDAMVDDKVFISYGWLKTVEETFIGDVNSKYVLVQDSKKLIGASVCYIFDETDIVYSLDNFMFGRFKKYAAKMGISFLPAFICCPMRCYGKHFLIEKDADAETTGIIMDEILETIEEEASERKLSVSLINVIEDEIELIELLNKRGYNKTLGFPLNYLDVEWSSFEGYKKHVGRISKNTKKSIKKEINKNRKEGVIIKQLENLGGYEDRLYELVNNNYYKHNQILFPFNREFFKRLKENLGEDVVTYISVKKERLTGMSLLLKRNKVSYFSVIGIDHEMAGNDFTYFNLGYYRPIMDAISDKTTRLYDGAGMYELKARRGFKISDTYIYYKSFNRIKNIALKPWYAFHSKWYECKLPKGVRKRA